MLLVFSVFSMNFPVQTSVRWTRSSVLGPQRYALFLYLQIFFKLFLPIFSNFFNPGTPIHLSTTNYIKNKFSCFFKKIVTIPTDHTWSLKPINPIYEKHTAEKQHVGNRNTPKRAQHRAAGNKTTPKCAHTARAIWDKLWTFLLNRHFSIARSSIAR